MNDELADRSLYALALLYLVCSHATDGELNQTEVDAVTKGMREWRPDASPQFLGSVLAKALELHRSLMSEADQARRVNVCAQLVVRDLEPGQLPKVIGDLRAIVEADGLVSEGEDQFLEIVEQAFGLA